MPMQPRPCAETCRPWAPSLRSCMSSSARDALFCVGDCEVGEAVDVPFELVTGLDRAHARRGARINQVPGLQRNESGQIRNRFRNIPDELAQIPFLYDRAIDLEPD